MNTFLVLNTFPTYFLCTSTSISIKIWNILTCCYQPGKGGCLKKERLLLSLRAFSWHFPRLKARGAARNSGRKPGCPIFPSLTCVSKIVKCERPCNRGGAMFGEKFRKNYQLLTFPSVYFKKGIAFQQHAEQKGPIFWQIFAEILVIAKISRKYVETWSNSLGSLKKFSCFYKYLLNH